MHFLLAFHRGKHYEAPRLVGFAGVDESIYYAGLDLWGRWERVLVP
ncbi:MAG: hypothetical protein M3541_20470 [Acidobacteriota bacterium]|nr:hypothetical protein [Acidobacteriota bacterium]